MNYGIFFPINSFCRENILMKDGGPNAATIVKHSESEVQVNASLQQAE